jgi:glycosyltransferase involved in cell wall biosynthesis
MHEKPSISVILPVFNEEQNLAATVEDAVCALEKIGTDYEIVIVDDGSTDATPEVCRDVIGRFDRVRAVSHLVNRGYGAALRSGFKTAQCDLIFFTDADGQFRFNQLTEFISRIDKVDMVIGYRAHRQDHWPRRLNSRLGNWFARAFLEVRARDINCAYKLMWRESLRQLALTSNGAIINTELLTFAARAGWDVRELPVKHFPRNFGRATGANARVIGRTIIEFFRLWRRFAKRRGEVHATRPAPALML